AQTASRFGDATGIDDRDQRTQHTNVQAERAHALHRSAKAFSDTGLIFMQTSSKLRQRACAAARVSPSDHHFIAARVILYQHAARSVQAEPGLSINPGPASDVVSGP